MEKNLSRGFKYQNIFILWLFFLSLRTWSSSGEDIMDVEGMVHVLNLLLFQCFCFHIFTLYACLGLPAMIYEAVSLNMVSSLEGKTDVGGRGNCWDTSINIVKKQEDAISRVRQFIFSIEIFLALRRGKHYHLCACQVWN